MTLSPGTYPIGPDTGPMKLYTTRAGVAAMVGHDLTITFQKWSGQVVAPDEDPTSAHLSVEIELDTLEILDGTGGAVALSGDDRKDITATAQRLLDVDRDPRATFVSTAVTASGDGGTIEGELTLRGQSVPVSVEVSSTGPTSWRASAIVTQSTFGIKPYRAFFGALKLSDDVRIEVDVNLPAAT